MLLFATRPASAENARLPYHHIYHIQQVQAQLSRAHTNLVLALQMRSTSIEVNFSNLTATIDSKSGKIAVPIGKEGDFTVPENGDLLAEDPWIVVNQPAGTMELNWHAGLAPALVRRMTNSFHYAPLLRAARECDDVQETMHQFFPAAPRLTAVGLRLVFRTAAIAPAAIIHCRDGDRTLVANSFGELDIPLTADLLKEDPLMTLTECPAAVEIVTRKGE
jgi:hypothetical protein